jgi:hypothetical protein
MGALERRRALPCVLSGDRGGAGGSPELEGVVCCGYESPLRSAGIDATSFEMVDASVVLYLFEDRLDRLLSLTVESAPVVAGDDAAHGVVAGAFVIGPVIPL